jgi:hypothetical protein
MRIVDMNEQSSSFQGGDIAQTPIINMFKQYHQQQNQKAASGNYFQQKMLSNQQPPDEEDHRVILPYMT